MIFSKFSEASDCKRAARRIKDTYLEDINSTFDYFRKQIAALKKRRVPLVRANESFKAYRDMFSTVENAVQTDPEERKIHQTRKVTKSSPHPSTDDSGPKVEASGSEGPSKRRGRRLSKRKRDMSNSRVVKDSDSDETQDDIKRGAEPEPKENPDVVAHGRAESEDL